MIARLGVALALAGALTACRADGQGMALGGPGYGVLSAHASTGEATRPETMPQKTLGDRIMAAMALERVTGMKPDSARLLVGD